VGVGEETRMVGVDASEVESAESAVDEDDDMVSACSATELRIAWNGQEQSAHVQLSPNSLSPFQPASHLVRW
jgi:hypothetical protein